MGMESYIHSLELFLQSETLKCLLLSGDWGVGKTHFWQTFWEREGIRVISNTGPVRQYAYISLFGAKSIDDLRLRAFLTSTSVAEDAKSKRARGQVDGEGTAQLKLRSPVQLKNKLLSFVPRTIRNAISDSGVVSGSSLSDVFQAASHMALDHSILVLDDLERRSSSLELREILGWIDDLAKQHHCKVVAICNQSALLPKDTEVLNDYRDKVFDVELKLRLTPAEICSIGIAEEGPMQDAAVKVLTSVGISNIRAAQKTYRLLKLLQDRVVEAHIDVQSEIAEHAAIFCWIRFDKNSKIAFNNLRSLYPVQPTISLSIRRDRGDQLTEEEGRWLAVVETTSFHAAEWDEPLLQLIEEGILESEALDRIAISDSWHAMRREGQSAIDEVWKYYKDTFGNDHQEFVRRLSEVVAKYGDYFFPSDLDTTLSPLERAGIDVSPIVDAYRAHDPASLFEAGLSNGTRLHSASLSELGAELLAEGNRAELLSLDSVFEHHFKSDSWNPEHVTPLIKASVEDLANWMRPGKPNLLRKIAAVKARFQHSHPEIRQKLDDAVRSILTDTPMDLMRSRSLLGIIPR